MYRLTGMDRSGEPGGRVVSKSFSFVSENRTRPCARQRCKWIGVKCSMSVLTNPQVERIMGIKTSKSGSSCGSSHKRRFYLQNYDFLIWKNLQSLPRLNSASGNSSESFSKPRCGDIPCYEPLKTGSYFLKREFLNKNRLLFQRNPEFFLAGTCLNH